MHPPEERERSNVGWASSKSEELVDLWRSCQYLVSVGQSSSDVTQDDPVHLHHHRTPTTRSSGAFNHTHDSHAGKENSDHMHTSMYMCILSCCVGSIFLPFVLLGTWSRKFTLDVGCPPWMTARLYAMTASLNVSNVAKVGIDLCHQSWSVLGTCHLSSSLQKKLNIVLQSVLLLSFPFWHCSFLFPCSWCANLILVVHSFVGCCEFEKRSRVDQGSDNRNRDRSTINYDEKWCHIIVI